MVRALSQVADWPVGAAAVAVVGPAGVVDAVGPRSERFPLASVTKLLTAWAALLAVDEGACALDDPAGPEGSTLRHLLAHASGLPFEGAAPIASPGARRIYSNIGYELIGAHVEAVTGFAFWEYVREGVCEPIDMRAVQFQGSPAHGARATLDDLVAFAGECFAPRVLAPSSQHAATSVQFPGLVGVVPGFGRQDPCDWGLGPELHGTKHPHWMGSRNAAATFGHFGRSGAFIWVDPVANVALVGMSDTPFGEWAVAAWPKLADAVLAELGVPFR